MAAIGTLLCVAAPLMAQTQIPHAPKVDKPWLAGAISALLIIGVLVGSFKPTKRGHQD